MAAPYGKITPHTLYSLNIFLLYSIFHITLNVISYNIQGGLCLKQASTLPNHTKYPGFGQQIYGNLIYRAIYKTVALFIKCMT